MTHMGSKKQIKVVNTTVTNGSPTLTAIVPAQSGFAIELLKVIAVNLEPTTEALKIFNGDQPLTPPTTIASSGTFLWEAPGDQALTGGIGSGIAATVTSAGSLSSGFDVFTYFSLDDQRTPVTKSQARANSRSGVTVTRAPNRFGGQSES